MKGRHPNKNLMDLGLAIGAATLQPGQTRTQREIAAFVQAAGTHCSYVAIQHIENRALRKIRVALYRDKKLQAALKERFLI
jgi:hypothetical protein